MPNKETIANSIIASRQVRPVEEELINFLKNALVAEEDGVYRVLDRQIDVDEFRQRDRGNKFREDIVITPVNRDAPEKGYLVISPRQGQGEDTPAPRHLALKVDNNKFWTISAIKGGTELEIGILEKGEHRAVISFNEDSALSLKKELKLGAGLSSINEDGKLKGISSSGLKGFKEGRLKASGKWESTDVKIPKHTFGKYRLQAWLIQTHHNRFSHLETVFIFFPEKQPIQKVKIQCVNSTTLKKFYYTISEWWTEKILKQSTEDNQGKWIDRLDAKIDKVTGEIMVKCKRIIEADRKIIYYTIERLWEGEYWAEDKAKEPQQTETE